MPLLANFFCHSHQEGAIGAKFQNFKNPESHLDVVLMNTVTIWTLLRPPHRHLLITARRYWLVDASQQRLWSLTLSVLDGNGQDLV